MEPTKLILRKLNNTLSKEEEKYFNDWLQASSENKALFKRLEQLKKQGVDISKIEKFDREQAWNKVLYKYNRLQKVRTRNFNIYKYAAILVLFVSFGYGTYNYLSKENTLNNIDPNAVTLRLENGEIRVLNEESSNQILDHQGNVLSEKDGTKLSYKETIKTEKLVYNTLTVPYGKTFEVILSDGTKVNVNAGSSISYPIKFLKGKKRRVFLDGEAYFDVSEDKMHPFIVKTSKMKVEVLGTEFNVSSYPEDGIVNTVLVEGSVALSNLATKNMKSKELVRLKPNEKASWNKRTSRIKVSTVDTDLYTSWINGRLVIKDMRFKNIIKKLERKYDVNIKNNYYELGNERFTASFDSETIEEVLSSFAENKAFNFKVTNRTIVINKN